MKKRRVAFLLVHDVADYDYTMSYPEQCYTIKDLVGDGWVEVTDEEYDALRRCKKFLNSFLGVRHCDVMLIEEAPVNAPSAIIAGAMQHVKDEITRVNNIKRSS